MALYMDMGGAMVLFISYRFPCSCASITILPLGFLMVIVTEIPVVDRIAKGNIHFLLRGP